MKQKPLSLDDTDLRIIEELQKNGRESYKNIAKRLGVSDGTVRLRTERMIKSGYLRISASVNPMFFENTLTAYVGLNLEKRANLEIMDKIGAIKGVQSVVNVTGKWDLLVELSVDSRKELRQFVVDKLYEVGGVVNTETYMVLEAINKWVEV